MKNLRHFGMVLLACALLMTTAGIATSQDTRPFELRAAMTFVIDLLTGQTTLTATGEGLHIGRVIIVGSGTTDETGYMAGSGTDTAANGDLLSWDATGHLYPSDLVVVFDGGTGRFEGATGELNSWDVTNIVQNVVGTTMTITCDAHATGWLRY